MKTDPRAAPPGFGERRRRAERILTGSGGMAAVTVEGLRKDYGGLRAVDGLSFAIEEGEVFALLGPNGAGKTTTVEILEGYRQRNAGEVSVLGFDPASGGRAYRERIGIVLQEAGLDPELTVHELVEMYGGFYPRRHPPDQVIELVGLSEKRTARVKTLSGGQRRRLDLALGLVGDPDLLFLDEPTTGFDPSARRRAWELVARLRALGKTILLTTHYMDEAQHLADRVVVIARGNVIAEGTPDTLGRGADEAALVAFRIPYGVGADELPLPGGAEVERRDRQLSFRTHTPTRDLAPLLSWAAESEIELEALSVTRPTLEDVYLQLTEEPA
ncbi:MAG TPA: ABC transporter ATP-binding protein [Actinomycetota bacterium]|nr:ABC transporter ATP-binding protein [Actinomycetota bacterium]